MKSKLLFLPIFFMGFGLFAQSGSISLPELCVLYKNWNNKIIPTIPCGDSMEIKIEGGTISPQSWVDIDGNSYKGYIVDVLPDSRIVSIELLGINQKNEKKSYGIFRYKAKTFPSPQIQGTTISKFYGTKLIVSLGADSPFTGVQFQVTGGEVSVGNKVYPFTGDRIPASIINECKPGNTIEIVVFFTRNGEKQTPISGSLKVVN